MVSIDSIACMAYITCMAKKFTISLSDKEAATFSMEIFKSQLIQKLLKEHYKKHQPNEFVVDRLKEGGYKTETDLVTMTSVIKDTIETDNYLLPDEPKSKPEPITYKKTSNWGA